MIFSENRCPLFGIMLWHGRTNTNKKPVGVQTEETRATAGRANKGGCPMRRHAVPRRASAQPRAAALPRFIIPCPFCAGQMVVATVEPSRFDAAADDITHRCVACGCALTQTIAPPGRERRWRADKLSQ
jgi:hypothetical protein